MQTRRTTRIPDGHAVEVRNRFEDHWVNGFAVAEHGQGGYRLRRLSDGRVLPAWFSHEVVRPCGRPGHPGDADSPRTQSR